jgi:2-polyprenyl-6-methoxyphenol hydroxylase-like FAD-dependent oxidoreductase
LASTRTQVAVVGAGPSGLTLASCLASHGVDTRLIERAETPPEHSRAAVVHARTLETLSGIDAADDLVARGVALTRFVVRDGDAVLGRVDFSHLPTRFPFALMVPQDTTERVLERALRSLGGEVHRSCELRTLEVGKHDCELRLRTGGHTSVLKSDFVVGCDGVHSTVREALGVGFRGGSYEESFLLADVRLHPTPPPEVELFLSPDGVMLLTPLPDGVHRVVGTTSEDAEPTADTIQRILASRGPTDAPTVTGTEWTSKFHVHHRIAGSLRRGRAFLCGDAAHVHSPAGGQGMNTGIQDAQNLAAKLAAACAGGDDAALDSYERERLPVIERTVRLTDRMTRLATLRGRIGRTTRNALLAAALGVPPLHRRLAMNLSQLNVPQP